MALLVTRRASTSMSGWLGWTLPCLPHEETRVSWEAQLEGTRLDEVQDEATQLGEQCEGEGGCTRVSIFNVKLQEVSITCEGVGRVGRRREGGRGLLDQQDWVGV